jgi:hypothetical protein
MIEALLKIALGEKSEPHKIVSLLLKILLTLIVSIRLYGLWLGNEWLQRFINWITTGEILIGIGLYFAIWFFFYGFLRSVILVGSLTWVGKRTDTFFESMLADFKTVPTEDRMKVKRFSFLKRLGIIAIDENKIYPGWLVLEIANDIKKTEGQKEEKQIITPSTDPCLVIHFVVTVLMMKSLCLLPLWIHIICTLIIIAILLSGFLAFIVRYVIVKYHHQLTLLAEQYNAQKIK